MESLVKGVVEATSKKGKGYNIKVGEAWYGFGFEKPSASNGDTVEFRYTMNGQWKNVDKDTFKVVKKSTSTSSRSTTQSEYDKTGYWQEKDKRDIVNDKKREIGASRNTAIEFVNLLVANNALKLPTTTAKIADVLEEAVKYYTLHFINQSESLVSLDNAANAKDADEDESDEKVVEEDEDEDDSDSEFE